MIALAEGTMVTTTTYGSWLPGDIRGYVDQGQVLPPEPRLRSYAKGQMTDASVVFSPAEQRQVFDALCAAACEFNYRLSDVVVEPTHVHWIIAHDDAVPTMVGRLKNRVRQALARGRLWTHGYCARQLATMHELTTAREYFSRHPGARMLASQPVQTPT